MRPADGNRDLAQRCSGRLHDEARENPMRVWSAEQVGEFRRDVDLVERLAGQWRNGDAMAAGTCRALGGCPDNPAVSIGEQEHSRALWHEHSFLGQAVRSAVSPALDVE